MTDKTLKGTKDLVKSLLLLALFLVVVYGTNVMVDPANIVNPKYARRAAAIMAEGHNVTNVQNMDDRELIRRYARLTDREITTLILGSSRSMQFTTDVTGDKNSFCAGVTGADLRDSIGAYILFKESGQKPQKVVFCAEYWFLSPTNLDSRALAEEYERFCKQTGNTPFKAVSRRQSMLKEIFSFSYFQSSIDFLLKEHDMPDLEATDEADCLYATRRSDGTYSYELAYRSRSEKDVRTEVIAANSRNTIVKAFSAVDDELKKQLEDFVVMMQNDGAEVVIQLSPFHPDFYAYMLENGDTFDQILATEDYFYSLGKKYGIEVCGGYNPGYFGMEGTDFYDGQHPTAQGAYKYYGVKRS